VPLGAGGEAAIAEPLGPDLVEHGPVTLKIRMTMPTRTMSVSAAPAAARIAWRLVKICSTSARAS
jgi:hypothetical protein